MKAAGAVENSVKSFRYAFVKQFVTVHISI